MKCSPGVFFFSPFQHCAPHKSVCDANLPLMHPSIGIKIWGMIFRNVPFTSQGGFEVLSAQNFNLLFEMILHCERIWQDHRWKIMSSWLRYRKGRRIHLRLPRQHLLRRMMSLRRWRRRSWWHIASYNAASIMIFLNERWHLGPVILMHCSLIYRIISHAEFIYPWSFFLLNIQFNYCRTKSFPSHQLRHGIQHHLKASQAELWKSINGLIDQTASATLRKDKGIYAQGDAISYHPLPSSSHKGNFQMQRSWQPGARDRQA